MEEMCPICGRHAHVKVIRKYGHCPTCEVKERMGVYDYERSYIPGEDDGKW